jgi:hypothetical protein
MEFLIYLAAFFCGAFFANAVPHFVQGISGNKFPTPFAKPPGKGLSSPILNVAWGLLNMVIGWLLVGPGHVFAPTHLPLYVAFLGAAIMSILLSSRFQQKHKE